MRTFEKKTLTRDRRSVFSAFTALAAVAVFAACSYPSAPAAETADPAAIFPDAAGLVRVTVPLPAGGGGGSDPVTSISRSVSKTGIRIEADYYEAVFKTIPNGGDPLPTRVKPYYTGAANKEDGYINIAVTPGYSYKVLLLAGSTDYQNRTLLAIGYTTATINTGVNNIVSIIMNAVPLQWDTSILPQTLSAANDFKFTAISSGTTNLPISIGNRYVHISPDTTEVPDGSPAADVAIPATAVLSVQFNAGKLADLFKAERVGAATTGGSLTFAARNVRIDAVRTTDAKGFATINLEPARLTGGTLNTSAELLLNATGESFVPAASTNDAGLANLTITFKNSATAPNILPANNKDGYLIFELDYYAFGTAESGGKLWTIRNGLNSNPDTKAKTTGTTGDGAGGAFHLVFGAGDPNLRDEEIAQIKKPVNGTGMDY
ncbi:MAG: hypothetical protein LBU18_01115 [Treponema sp.]|jgi:hypothetical protein|nr:hypothetical protein [Treponema sp.]